jgi:hypothetical protein
MFPLKGNGFKPFVNYRTSESCGWDSANYLLDSQYQTTLCGLRDHHLNPSHCISAENSCHDWLQPYALAGLEIISYTFWSYLSILILTPLVKLDLLFSLVVTLWDIVIRFPVKLMLPLIDKKEPNSVFAWVYPTPFGIRSRSWCFYHNPFITITGFILWTSSSPYFKYFSKNAFNKIKLKQGRYYLHDQV